LNIYTIIVAAGKGERVGFTTPKQYLELNNKKLLYYSLNKFTKVDLIKKTFVALSNNDEFFNSEDYSDLSNFEILFCGGKGRSHTIHNALKMINAEKDDWIIIHDAARPFLNIKVLEDLISSIKNQPESDGYVVAEKVNSTIKKTKNMQIEQTVSRDDIWLAQTPQAFKFKDMNEIYGKVENLHLYTDDSSIMEKFNYNAKIIDSNFMNFKITTRDDYEIAKFIVKKLDDGYL
jgi:2-C-methyl-D-erythritol 4-phosphate cytidylyltransferase